jgi:NADH:ubiquinone oxidoreductase subunit C
MDLTSSLQSAEDLLHRWIAGMKTPSEERLDVLLPSNDLLEAVKIIKKAQWGVLTAITGLDHPAPAPVDGKPAPEAHLELLYHFCEGAAVLTLRVNLPYSKPIVQTLCNIYPYATLYERELIELFGVVVKGTPNTDRLVLPDDWPDGVYPLRKSFTGFNHPPRPTDEPMNDGVKHAG